MVMEKKSCVRSVVREDNVVIAVAYYAVPHALSNVNPCCYGEAGTIIYRQVQSNDMAAFAVELVCRSRSAFGRPRGSGVLTMS